MSGLPCYSERGLDEALEEPEEPAQIAVTIEFGKGARVLPILEAEPLAKGIAAEHRDESKDDQGDNQEDLSQRGPELTLTVPLHSEQVNKPETMMVRLESRR